MIRVYPSILPGEPIETHEASGVTIEQWLLANVEGYGPRDEHPLSIAVDGVVVPPERWAETPIHAGTQVDIRIQPGKSVVRGVSSAISSVVSAVVSAVQSIFGFLLPSMPGVDQARQGRQGSSIYEPNAQANQAKLGGVVPELAGQHKTFPDYLNVPRRYFVDQQTMALDMMLCITSGHAVVPDAQIRIGATPVQALGQSVNYQVFEPGQSVTSHQAHRLWYSAPEVGASLGSSSGLRLKSTTDMTPALSASAITLNGANITVPPGAGTPPEDWVAGMRLSVKLFVDLEVIDGGEDGGTFLRDILIGDFSQLDLEPGDPVTIVSPDGGPNGDFIVHTYTAGTSEDPDELTLSNTDLTPAAFLPIGYWLADVDLTGTLYRIDGVITGGFTVTRLLPSGADDLGWPGFDSRTTADFRIRLDTSNLEGNWAGPFLACPEGETTSMIEWDIFAPQGLGRIRDDASISERTRTVELQWRASSASDWTSVTREVSGKTRDQLGWTFTVNLPSAMTPEVRVRRVSVEETGVQDLDRLEWLGLRALMPGAPTSYDGVTTMALTIIGSDTIAGQTENRVSCVPTRLLPAFDTNTLHPSRSIAEWVRHVARSVGYTDDDLNIEELKRLDETWDARGDFFDFVHDTEGTVKQVLERALAAGHAELTFEDGLLTPVRDELRTTLEDGYSAQNMTSPLQFAAQAIRPDDHDGVDVEYFDGTTWSTETVPCRLPGDQGLRVDKIRVEGVRSRTRAWRIGMRERRKQRYRRWAFQFSTELDALNSRYLSYCPLITDIPGYSASALLEAVEVDGDHIHLSSSEPLQWQDGKQHVIAWRRPSGTTAGPFPALPGDDEYHVIANMSGVSDADYEVPVLEPRHEPPHLYFGTSEEWCFEALITAVRPRGLEGASVEAVNYDPRVYADDDNAPT